LPTIAAVLSATANPSSSKVMIVSSVCRSESAGFC
jgi:hypothetical protein